ncbi:hypothetical protein BDL97_13G117800 [Sphagnum fallax]|nr:hypothetical protein BDL97_13G117800 [Sphagnum fallax]
MDSIEGQLYDIPADCHPRDLGDSDVELLGLEKKKARGLSDHRSGPSSFFWASEEDEMESAPPGVKNKLKRMIQATDCPEVVDEAGGVLEKVEERWHELPPELLVQILALVDHRTVVVVTGVCSSWRQSISTGIHELSFSWCGRSVSKLVQSVAPHFLSLQSCNLRRCMYLVDPAIEAIGAHWHDLRTLDLSSGTRLTDASLYDLARGCTLLEKLDLSGCVGITEAGLVVLAECCKNLRHLNLCGCIIAGSDTALVALAQHCRSLQSLNLGWCEHITDIGVTALVIGCSDLRVLDLCGCHLITDQSVIVLSEKCHCLCVLGLHCCRNITDAAMYSLVTNSKWRTQSHLRRNGVNKPGAKSLNNSSRNNYGASHRSYTRSSTGSCSSSGSTCSTDASRLPALSKGGFDTLLGEAGGHGLVSLNLSGCTALSARAVQAVCDAFPELHTCPERTSLIISGCLNLTSVHCICVVEARRERSSRAALKAAQAFNLRNRH